mmetsp:Transcript_54022/g.66216  ORF Transcript_54022/g.66216 Transcript_54022/m.66216 type:complete len:359 (+) Transcript_54022:57-1133(+)
MWLFLCFCINIIYIHGYPTIKVKLLFSDTLPRLGNAGTPEDIPSGNAAQVPMFGKQSVHWIELAGDLTPIGDGIQLYKSPVYTGENVGSDVIDHEQLILVENNTIFLNVDLGSIKKPGVYTYVRTSVAYQEYKVLYNILNAALPSTNIVYNVYNQIADIASFLGVKTYIKDFNLDGSTFTVNEVKLQGFGAMKGTINWGASSEVQNDLTLKTYCQTNDCTYNYSTSWDGTPGATTVPNLNPDIPIPIGSCIVVGRLDPPLIITDNDWDIDTDILLTLQYSINGSFEWIDSNSNGEWDIDGNNGPEIVTDMGTRGLWPVWENITRQETTTTAAPDLSLANKLTIYVIVYTIACLLLFIS